MGFGPPLAGVRKGLGEYGDPQKFPSVGGLFQPGLWPGDIGGLAHNFQHKLKHQEPGLASSPNHNDNSQQRISWLP